MILLNRNTKTIKALTLLFVCQSINAYPMEKWIDPLMTGSGFERIKSIENVRDTGISMLMTQYVHGQVYKLTIQKICRLMGYTASMFSMLSWLGIQGILSPLNLGCIACVSLFLCIIIDILGIKTNFRQISLVLGYSSLLSCVFLIDLNANIGALLCCVVPVFMFSLVVALISSQYKIPFTTDSTTLFRLSIVLIVLSMTSFFLSLLTVNSLLLSNLSIIHSVLSVVFAILLLLWSFRKLFTDEDPLYANLAIILINDHSKDTEVNNTIEEASSNLAINIYLAIMDLILEAIKAYSKHKN